MLCKWIAGLAAVLCWLAGVPTISAQQVAPSLSERVAAPDREVWQRGLLSLGSSPVDLSFLNAPERPAGKRGFLKAVDGRLAFEDGKVARFWGTNLTANALFRTGRHTVRLQAQRLSRLGFNLVRIHHHDSRWVKPNIFGFEAANTLNLDSQALRSLDWWIKSLGDEGIYVWLDLHVGRAFTADDEIDDFEEIAKDEPSAVAKGFAYINPSIEERMRAFNRAILNHTNHYTGLAYKDDPRIAFVLITNENDLSHYYGNALLPNRNVPRHSARFMAEAALFAERHNLDPRATWRSWEHGPSKLFLNDLEHRFNVRMIDDLRRLGVQVPIATTQIWGDMTLAGLPSMTDGDIVSVNAYGMPNFLQTDPRSERNLAHRVASAAVAGKPLAVTEWNLTPFPAVDRSSLPTYLAAIASLQRWDALMQYAYAQTDLGRVRPANQWEAANDPAMLVMMPAAALLFRQGHVTEGPQEYLLALSASQIIDHPVWPATSESIRTLAERSRMRIALPELPALPWLSPTEPGRQAVTVLDPNADFTSSSKGELCADTGEFCRDWRHGVFTVDTGKSQIASGWIGGRTIELDNVSFDIDTANASVAVQSLDGVPIGQSGHVLISVAAQSVPDPQHPAASMSEPVTGLLHVQAPPGLELFRLSRNGLKEPLATEVSERGYAITLDDTLRSHWLVLE